MADYFGALGKSFARRLGPSPMPAAPTLRLHDRGACLGDPAKTPQTTLAVAKRIGGLLLVVLFYVPFLYRQENVLAIENTFVEPSGGGFGIPERRLEAYGNAKNEYWTQEAELAKLVAAGRELESFPSVENSTVLFLHVFKCAGTTLREVLLGWATSEGWTGAVVQECKGTMDESNDHRICLNSKNNLMDMERVKWLVHGQKLLAGHFFWDFRRYVTQPYLMITTLRNPLELYISAHQFKHRAQTQTLEAASHFVSATMQQRLRWKDPVDIGFIRRFLPREVADHYRPQDVYSREEYNAMAQVVVDHLNTFWVVGVVEQFNGFLDVLKYLLDPNLKHTSLWDAARRVKNNGSPVASDNVLGNVDSGLIAEFNSTVLGVQWQVYGAVLELWDSRCREVLPTLSHSTLCAIPEME